MIQHERCEHMTMRHLRQLGLLNQPRLAQLRVLVSGQADEVADVLVMLDQLGVGQAGGSIGVQLTGKDNPSGVLETRLPRTHSHSRLGVGTFGRLHDGPHRSTIGGVGRSPLIQWTFDTKLDSPFTVQFPVRGQPSQ